MDPWVGKNPLRRGMATLSVFLPGSYIQRNLEATVMESRRARYNWATNFSFLWIWASLNTIMRAGRYAITIELIIISLGLKLPTRTRYGGSHKSRLELVMDRHDLTTHEGNGTRWNIPEQGLSPPVIWRTQLVCCFSLTCPKHSPSQRRW